MVVHPARTLPLMLLVGVLVPAAPLHADDAEIARTLKEKGVVVTETKGVITRVSVKEGDKLTDADFALIGKLAHLKMLDVNRGLTDARLASLAGLKELEYLQTNAAQVSDAGFKPLAQLKSLRNLKMFHPGKEFSGVGLAHLAELPNLRQLTVAGSFAFNDEGLAAVAGLPRLEEFRTWHAGNTNAGVKKLAAMKNLKSLFLGQRLTYKPPACPTDETLEFVAALKTLETLKLDETRLSLKAFQDLKKLPALKTLTLGGVQLVGGDLKKLQAELPKVKIVWTPPDEKYQKRIDRLFGSE